MKTLMSVFLFLFCVIVASASEWRTHSASDMNARRVFCVFPDASPYVWIGTDHGLRRYDGTRFKSYIHIDGDSTSLNENTVRKIIPARNGCLWVSTADGVHCYSPQSDSFRLIGLQGLDFHGYILDMVADGQDGVWFLVAGVGLYHVAFNDVEAQRLFTPDSHMIDIMRKLTIDRNGDLWICAENKDMIIRYSVTDGSITEYTLPESDVCSILTDRTGIPVVMVGENLIRFDYASASFKKVNLKVMDMSSEEFRRIDGPYTVDAARGLIMTFDDNNNALALRLLDLALCKIAPSLYFTSAALSPDEVLWMVAPDYGVMMIGKNKGKFDFLEYGRINDSHTEIAFPSACTSTGKNGIWLAFSNNAVIMLDASKEKKEIVHTAGLPTALTVDDGGRLFVWELGVGLCEYDYSTGSKRILMKASGNEYCRGLVYDGDFLLYGAVAGLGVFKYSLKNGLAEWFTAKNSGLVNDWVTALCSCSGSRLVIGHCGGVSVMNTVNSEIRALPESIGVNRVICNAIAEDNEGVIWIGSNRGLLAYSPHGKIRAYTVADGLSDDEVCFVAVGESGNVWCSTFNGIDRLTVSNSTIAGYLGGCGQADGMYERGIGAMTSDGTVYMAGPKGLTFFNVSDFTANVFDGCVILSDLYVNNRKISVTSKSGSRKILKNVLNDTDIVELSHNDNAFSILLSVSGCHDSRNIVYEYRIDGFDSGWRRLPFGESVLKYQDLSPGNYVLHIRAAENELPGPERMIKIIIRRPWYTTISAIAVYIAVLLTIMLLIYWHIRKKGKTKLSDAVNEDVSGSIDGYSKEIMQLFDAKHSLIHEMLGGMEPIVLKSNDDLLMERICRMVEDNLSDSEFNVESLCDGLSISRTHLHRKMKEILDMSASDFIRNVRLKHASELLKGRDVDISQIAYAVGFNNPSHFSTTFKKYYGVSPSDYRESNRHIDK